MEEAPRLNFFSIFWDRGLESILYSEEQLVLLQRLILVDQVKLEEVEVLWLRWKVVAESLTCRASKLQGQVCFVAQELWGEQVPAESFV